MASLKEHLLNMSRWEAIEPNNEFAKRIRHIDDLLQGFFLSFTLDNERTMKASYSGTWFNHKAERINWHIRDIADDSLYGTSGFSFIVDHKNPEIFRVFSSQEFNNFDPREHLKWKNYITKTEYVDLTSIQNRPPYYEFEMKIKSEQELIELLLDVSQFIVWKEV